MVIRRHVLVASGMTRARILRPTTRVTDRAKDGARGNWESYQAQDTSINSLEIAFLTLRNTSYHPADIVWCRTS